MNVAAFILALIAAVVFALDSRGWRPNSPASPVNNFVPLGLLFLTAALIVQFCTYSHPIHF